MKSFILLIIYSYNDRVEIFVVQNRIPSITRYFLIIVYVCPYRDEYDDKRSKKKKPIN